MRATNDFGVMMLPPPVRLDASFGSPIEEVLRGEIGELEGARRYLDAPTWMHVGL